MICNVTIDGKQIQYAKGKSLTTIAEEWQKNYEDDIVLAMLDDKLCELRTDITKDCEVKFITTGDTQGQNAYRRSICFLMLKAIHSVVTKDTIRKIRIHYSLHNGYYYTIEGDVKPDAAFLNEVKACMLALVKEDILIEKRLVHTEEAIRLFGEHKMYDKEKLFQYRVASSVKIYNIGDFEDYYYGYMVPSTRFLKYFELYPYDDGFVIQLPTKHMPREIEPFCPPQKLFQVLKETTKWGDEQGLETVGALNEQVVKGSLQEVVLVQEAMQERKIAEIAEQISKKQGVKFILVAGPSSSGKTTFSHRLSIQLKAAGLIPHPIGVDNYFVDRENTPRDESGAYNFECIEAIDVKQFNQDLTGLLQGQSVQLPVFDFREGKRQYTGEALQLGEHDILVIEGIHCLNPELTKALPDENKFKIYISALTQLNIDEHNRIPSTDGRLIRRIVRDVRTRGFNAKHTIGMWDSVRKGEEENIFRYQEEADVMFNSALVYELAVLKQSAEAALFAVNRDEVEYKEAKRLLKFLDYFVGIGSESIPANSLLREFVGGGCFKV
jgi:Uridine kinase